MARCGFSEKITPNLNSQQLPWFSFSLALRPKSKNEIYFKEEKKHNMSIPRAGLVVRESASKRKSIGSIPLSNQNKKV